MQIRESPFWLPMIRKGLRKGRTSLCVYDCKYGDRRNPFSDWFELELAGWQQAIKLMEDAVKLGKGDYVHRLSMELISSSQAMGTRGGGTSGSWFPGKPETPQKRHGKGAAAPPFPCLFCSRTDIISVLTGQGRSSSCKIWEVGTQSPLKWTFQPSSILLPSGFRSLDGRALSLEKTGNLGFPIFCSQQSDYPISCHLQMAAAQFAISVLRIMERRELRDA